MLPISASLCNKLNPVLQYALIERILEPHLNASINALIRCIQISIPMSIQHFIHRQGIRNCINF